MSDAQEGKNDKRVRQLMAQLRSDGSPRTWTADDLNFAQLIGGQIGDFAMPGDRFQINSVQDMTNLGLGSAASPVETMGLADYLRANNLDLRTYQDRFGALPFTFNEDGTATFDPAAQRQAFEYTPASYGRNLKIGVGLVGALAGAGLAGVGQGAGVAGADAAGVGAVNGLDLGTPWLTEPGFSAGSFAADIPIASSANAFEIPAGDYWSSAIDEVGSFAGGDITTGAGEFAADGVNWGSDIFNPASPTTFNGGPVTTGAGEVGAATAPPGSSSAMSRILSGNGTMDDWLKVGSTVASGALGIGGANAQSGAIKDAAARLDAIQSPWRARLNELYANPEGFLTSAPVRATLDQGTQAVGRALSTQYGNPAMSPNAMAEINKYAANSLYGQFGNEASRLAAFGGLNFPATTPATMSAQANDGGVYDAVGYTIGQLTAPKPQMTVADMVKAIAQGNIFSDTVRV